MFLLSATKTDISVLIIVPARLTGEKSVTVDNCTGTVTANGSLLKDSMADQGIETFIYESKSAEGCSSTEPCSYLIMLTVSGVPESIAGSKIVASPSGVEKLTR